MSLMPIFGPTRQRIQKSNKYQNKSGLLLSSFFKYFLVQNASVSKPVNKTFCIVLTKFFSTEYCGIQLL